MKLDVHSMIEALALLRAAEHGFRAAAAQPGSFPSAGSFPGTRSAPV